MTSTTWTGGNGDFNSAGNWSNGVPAAGVDAFIDGTVTAPLLVTFTAGTDVANSLTTTYTDFSLSGGSLTLTVGSSLANALTTGTAFSQSAGLFDFQNGGVANNTSTINGAGQGVVQTAGTLEVDAGLLQIYGNSSFAGTLSGAGAVAFRGSGTFTLDKGIALNIATLDLDDSANLTLDTNVTVAGTFADQTGSQTTNLNLNGHLLTLKGASFFTDSFDSVVVDGPGTLALTGTTTIASMALTVGATAVNTGTVSQTGYLELGDTGTDIDTLANQGTWQLGLSQTIAVGAAANSSITNTGLFEVTGNNGSASVDPQFVNAATGTIAVALGDTLQLYGNATSAGVIIGAGALAVRGESTLTLTNAAGLGIATLDLYDSATLNLGTSLSYAGTFADETGSAVTTINLNANTLTLTGAAYFTDSFADVLVTGGGTLALEGATQISSLTIGGGATLLNTGNVSQTGYFQLGDAGTGAVFLTNQGEWTISPNQTLATGANSSVVFNNTGTLQMTADGGTARINAELANAATGTIAIAAGDLLELYGNASLSGALSGAGALAVRGESICTVGAIDLYDSATLQLDINLAYAGAFSETTGSATTNLALNGHTLSLSGTILFDDSFASDLVSGPGTLALSGLTTLDELELAGAAAMVNTGTVNQNGFFQIGDASGAIATVANAATWDITAPGSIVTGSNSASSFTNTGLFEMTSTSGAEQVDAIFVSTGTVDAVNAGSVINFNDGGTFSGAIIGAGSVNIEGGHTYTLGGKITASVANLGILGAGTEVVDSIINAGYAGSLTLGAGATLTLDKGIKFTLDGTANASGVIDGAGTFLVGSASAQLVTNNLVLGGSATLLVQHGTLAENQNWTIGDGAASTASLELAKGTTYEITGDSGILSSGVGAIESEGTFEKLAGTGLSVIDPIMTNAGYIIANSGTLEFAQNITNIGTAAAENGNSLIFAGSVVATGSGHGVVALASGGDVTFGGFVSSAEKLEFSDTSVATATIDNPGSFSAAIAGFSGANTLDLKGVQNVTAAYAGTSSAGTLTLTETIGGSPVTVATLDFTGDFTLASFKIGNDGTGGTFVQTVAGAAQPPAPIGTIDIASSHSPMTADLPGLGLAHVW